MSPKVVMEMEGGEGTGRVRNRVWGPPHGLDVLIGSEIVKDEVEVGTGGGAERCQNLGSSPRELW